MEEHPIPYTLFKQIEDYFENAKAEIPAKEEFSKEDIQDLLINSMMEYSHYTAFVHKFVISMEEYRKCTIVLDVNKPHIFNAREENILSQHKAWRKHFRKKGE